MYKKSVNNKLDKPSKKPWSFPWKYKESFLFALLLLFTGVLLEVITYDRGINVPAFPHNMFALMIFVITLAFLHFFYRKSLIVKWLTSVPAAISSICLLSVVILLLGLLKQENQPGSVLTALGFTHVKNSWILILAQIYLLTVLGLVVFKRIAKLNKRNIGFLLNHAGLWIVIAGASLGTGDLQRLRMELHKGETIWYAYDDQNRVYELPFAVELQNFQIDEYPPKMAIVNSKTGKLIENLNSSLPEIHSEKEVYLGNYHIVVKDYLPAGWPFEGRFIGSGNTGAPPAAKVFVTNKNNNDTISGWISSGSFMVNPAYLFLTENKVLAMTQPEPRKYQSNVKIYIKEHNPYEEVIEVNAAPKVNGWHLYQVSYDQNRGKWSELSVLEIVRDPWLYIVYFGIAMLLAGAVYILWVGAGGTSGENMR